MVREGSGMKGLKEGREGGRKERDGEEKTRDWGDWRGLAHPIILTLHAPYA